MNSLYLNITKSHLSLNNIVARSVFLVAGPFTVAPCQEILDCGFERVCGIDVEFNLGRHTEHL